MHEEIHKMLGSSDFNRQDVALFKALHNFKSQQINSQNTSLISNKLNNKLNFNNNKALNNENLSRSQMGKTFITNDRNTSIGNKSIKARSSEEEEEEEEEDNGEEPNDEKHNYINPRKKIKTVRVSSSRSKQTVDGNASSRCRSGSSHKFHRKSISSKQLPISKHVIIGGKRHRNKSWID